MTTYTLSSSTNFAQSWKQNASLASYSQRKSRKGAGITINLSGAQVPFLPGGYRVSAAYLNERKTRRIHGSPLFGKVSVPCDARVLCGFGQGLRVREHIQRWGIVQLREQSKTNHLAHCWLDSKLVTILTAICVLSRYDRGGRRKSGLRGRGKI